MIALFAALQEEIRPIQRRLGLRPEHGKAPTCSWRGTFLSREIVLAQTGIGRRCAERTVQQVLATHPIEGVISVGFCGALVEELQVADVLVCSAVLCEPDNRRAGETLCVELAPQGVRAALHRAKAVVPRSFPGRCLTVSDLVIDRARKEHLAETSDAHIVDMESYWIARLAAQRHLPFLTVRSVSDSLHQEIPGIVHRSMGARRPRARIVAHILCHPGSIRSLFPLAARAFAAGRRLADAVAAVLEADADGEESVFHQPTAAHPA